MLTLRHFIQRQSVFNLYRRAIRASRAIPHPAARKETISWIRAEFERNRHITDLDIVEDKLSAGRRELALVLPYSSTQSLSRT